MTSESKRYLQSVDEQHRKSYGQFFTHPTVAQWMVDWVLQSGSAQLYDPAFGLGAFREALNGSRANCEIQFSASEIDAKILGFYADATKQDISFIAQEDYLTSWGRKHSNIVCNPPYMKFQQFHNRDAVAKLFAEHIDTKLPGHLNTASAFLLKSLSEMDGQGRLAYIMPMEFLNTNYGEMVKSRLIEGGHLHSIVHLNCEKEIFPDATTSVCVILYDANCYFPEVGFYSLGNIEELKSFSNSAPVRSVALESLNPMAKWLPYFQSEAASFNFDATQLVELSHYGRFSRGIATGANHFFVLRQSQARELGLGTRDYVACITRSSQITHPVWTQRDLELHISCDNPILLFSPQGQPSDSALKYIEWGESLEVQNAFLTSRRNPWYKTEVRAASPLLLGVFSRGGYKVILNQSNALNLTCYHGFQPNLFGQRYINHVFLYLLSLTGRNILSSSVRKYGGNLDKFEPNDLNASFAPSAEFFDSISPDEAELAVGHVQRSGKVPHRIEDIFGRLTNSKDNLQRV